MARWLYSTNAKDIGVWYIIFSIVAGLIGTSMLMMEGMDLMIKGMGEEEMIAMGIMARVKKLIKEEDEGLLPEMWRGFKEKWVMSWWWVWIGGGSCTGLLSLKMGLGWEGWIGDFLIGIYLMVFLLGNIWYVLEFIVSVLYVTDKGLKSGGSGDEGWNWGKVGKEMWKGGKAVLGILVVVMIMGVMMEVFTGSKIVDYMVMKTFVGMGIYNELEIIRMEGENILRTIEGKELREIYGESGSRILMDRAMRKWMMEEGALHWVYGDMEEKNARELAKRALELGKEWKLRWR